MPSPKSHFYKTWTLFQPSYNNTPSIIFRKPNTTEARGGGGVLTDKWHTGMLKGFEVHFRKFWYIDGWVIVTYPMRPICKSGRILENLAKNATNLPQIRCFLKKKMV